jgi:hypothetical protein
MTRAGRAAVAVVAALALPTSARAADGPAEAAPPPSAPAEAAPGSGPAEAAPAPAPTGAPYAPPPAFYAPPPPLDGPAPGAVTPQQLTAYESGSKSRVGALALELFIPGLGSIYADHAQGALVTWLGIIAGTGMVVYGAVNLDEPPPRDEQGETMLSIGVLMLVGFRIYGVVDAWSSAGEYNEELATRLGMHAMSLTVAPVATAHGPAWGPSLSLRF